MRSLHEAFRVRGSPGRGSPGRVRAGLQGIAATDVPPHGHQLVEPHGRGQDAEKLGIEPGKIIKVVWEKTSKMMKQHGFVEKRDVATRNGR